MGRHPASVVFGCNGPVGTELMHQLAALGRTVRGVCRSGKVEAPGSVEVAAGDAADAAQVAQLAAGAATVYCCIGVDYSRYELWPPIVEGLLGGCARAGVPLVFADNLYCYGPVDGPLREDLPTTKLGRKPALRARVAERLLGAHAAGTVRVAIARASDFYGPRVLVSALGERVFPAALAGRAAQVLGDPAQPHAYTYVPDFARAVITLADHDDAFGQAWHVPNAPARSTREVVEAVFRLAGTRPRVSALPAWLVGLLRPFVPVMGELAEMMFQWQRPYLVDHSKYARRFGDHATPLEQGLAATLAWYRLRATT